MVSTRSSFPALLAKFKAGQMAQRKALIRTQRADLQKFYSKYGKHLRVRKSPRSSQRVRKNAVQRSRVMGGRLYKNLPGHRMAMTPSRRRKLANARAIARRRAAGVGPRKKAFSRLSAQKRHRNMLARARAADKRGGVAAGPRKKAFSRPSAQKRHKNMLARARAADKAYAKKKSAFIHGLFNPSSSNANPRKKTSPIRKKTSSIRKKTSPIRKKTSSIRKKTSTRKSSSLRTRVLRRTTRARAAVRYGK